MATKTTTTPKTTTKKTSKRGKPAPAAKPPRAKNSKAAPAKTATPEAEVRKPTKAAKPAKEKKASGLDLAAKVLVEAGEPLAAKTIAERVIAAGWQTSGATPHATLYAAIGREIATKGKDARFKKTGRGLFTATTTNGKEA